MRYGLTFRDRNSIRDFGAYVRNDNRSVLPELRKNEYIIPGRDGSLDYGLNTRETRTIAVALQILRPDYPSLREQVRRVAQWLSGSGLLIFDDEPDKAYQAKVYRALSLEEAYATGVVPVFFHCQPFAESPYYHQRDARVTTSPETIPLEVAGYANTCCTITITNVGTSTINNLTLTRKAVLE